MIRVPDAFAAFIVASHGEAGRAWIDRLPAAIDTCLERWSLVQDGPVLHGHVGIVLLVARADGAPAVLKLSWLDEASRWEPHALAAWDGRGAVRLLDRDDAAGALLLERLDPQRSVRELDGVAAAGVIGGLCRLLDVPAPAGLPRLEDLAARWTEELVVDWLRLGRPFSSHVLETAIDTCRTLGPGQPDRLLHGNLQFLNVLRSEREPWLVIDPNGLAGEVAYEAAAFQTNRWKELTAQPDLRTAIRDRLAAFADAAGTDPERARRWAHVHMTCEALWCREHQPDVVSAVDAVIDALG
jgi:streptomycin 6-kinase